MKEIPLTRGRVALVDDEDYDYLMQWKWYTNKTLQGKFYAARSLWNLITKKIKNVCMHRVIIDAKKGEEVDHKDGNGLNNQRGNLRLCTRAQNNANSKLQKNSTSGYKGATFDRHAQKWQAHIMYNRRHLFLGYYGTSEEAARAYDKKAIELFGEFARPNFPRRVARRKVA